MVLIPFRYCLIAIIAVTLLVAPTARAQDIPDSDGDGLSDYDEIFIYHTDPKNFDSDFDGFIDGYEVADGFSPLWPKLTLKEADTDGDGIMDDWEILLGTDLTEKDTDGDGKDDYQEIMIDATSPTSWDNKKIEKRIEVDIKNFQLTYYFGETLMDTVLVSSGAKGWPTPKGHFTIKDKDPNKLYRGPGYYLPNTKWNLHYANKYGTRYWIHGAYWHNLFGKRNVSHGCINVAYKDMERLYHFTPVGTKVFVF